LKPTLRRTLVMLVQEAYGKAVTRVFWLTMISRSLWHYRARGPAQRTLEMRPKKLSRKRRRLGYRQLHVIPRREG
jgi:hypothetical protein